MTKKLDNKISKITGLAKCTRLQDLSLAHNKIEKIHGLENLPIQSLNLVGIAMVTKPQSSRPCITRSCDAITLPSHSWVLYSDCYFQTLSVSKTNI